jgi:hypothetical protein
MNKSFHNIEKLPGKTYWVGYSRTGSRWRITKVGRQMYQAMERRVLGDDRKAGEIGCFHARTLADCSKKLESL